MAIDPSTANPLATSDDPALILRIADRRPEALAELYDRYAPLLLAVVRQVLPQRADAEEALQATFFEVWHQAGRYDPGRSSVSAWLVLLARDRALERATKTEGRADSPSEAQVETLPGVQVESPTIGQRRQRVQAALAAVPAGDRELLAIALFEGLSPQKVAERRRMPVEAVRRQMAWAMKQLRRELRAEIRELM